MSTNNNLECSECNKKFKSKSGMITHTKTCKENKFYCNFCETNFSSNRNLNNHRMNCSKKNLSEVKENLEKQNLELITNYENKIKLIQEELITNYENKIKKIKNVYQYKIEDLELQVKIQNETIKLLKEIQPTTNITNNYSQ